MAPIRSSKARMLAAVCASTISCSVLAISVQMEEPSSVRGHHNMFAFETVKENEILQQRHSDGSSSTDPTDSLRRSDESSSMQSDDYPFGSFRKHSFDDDDDDAASGVSDLSDDPYERHQYDVRRGLQVAEFLQKRIPREKETLSTSIRDVLEQVSNELYYVSNELQSSDRPCGGSGLSADAWSLMQQVWANPSQALAKAKKLEYDQLPSMQLPTLQSVEKHLSFLGSAVGETIMSFTTQPLFTGIEESDSDDSDDDDEFGYERDSESSSSAGSSVAHEAPDNEEIDDIVQSMSNWVVQTRQALKDYRENSTDDAYFLAIVQEPNGRPAFSRYNPDTTIFKEDHILLIELRRKLRAAKQKHDTLVELTEIAEKLPKYIESLKEMQDKPNWFNSFVYHQQLSPSSLSQILDPPDSGKILKELTQHLSWINLRCGYEFYNSASKRDIANIEYISKGHASKLELLYEFGKEIIYEINQVKFKKSPRSSAPVKSLSDLTEDLCELILARIELQLNRLWSQSDISTHRHFAEVHVQLTQQRDSVRATKYEVQFAGPQSADHLWELASATYFHIDRIAVHITNEIGGRTEELFKPFVKKFDEIIIDHVKSGELTQQAAKELYAKLFSIVDAPLDLNEKAMVLRRNFIAKATKHFQGDTLIDNQDPVDEFMEIHWNETKNTDEARTDGKFDERAVAELIWMKSLMKPSTAQQSQAGVDSIRKLDTSIRAHLLGHEPTITKNYIALLNPGMMEKMMSFVSDCGESVASVVAGIPDALSRRSMLFCAHKNKVRNTYHYFKKSRRVRHFTRKLESQGLSNHELLNQCDTMQASKNKGKVWKWLRMHAWDEKKAFDVLMQFSDNAPVDETEDDKIKRAEERFDQIVEEAPLLPEEVDFVTDDAAPLESASSSSMSLFGRKPSLRIGVVSQATPQSSSMIIQAEEEDSNIIDQDGMLFLLNGNVITMHMQFFMNQKSWMEQRFDDLLPWFEQKFGDFIEEHQLKTFDVVMDGRVEIPIGVLTNKVPMPACCSKKYAGKFLKDTWLYTLAYNDVVLSLQPQGDECFRRLLKIVTSKDGFNHVTYVLTQYKVLAYNVKKSVEDILNEVKLDNLRDWFKVYEVNNVRTANLPLKVTAPLSQTWNTFIKDRTEDPLALSNMKGHPDLK